MSEDIAGNRTKKREKGGDESSQKIWGENTSDTGRWLEGAGVQKLKSIIETSHERSIF